MCGIDSKVCSDFLFVSFACRLDARIYAITEIQHPNGLYARLVYLLLPFGVHKDDKSHDIRLSRLFLYCSLLQLNRNVINLLKQTQYEKSCLLTSS